MTVGFQNHNQAPPSGNGLGDVQSGWPGHLPPLQPAQMPIKGGATKAGEWGSGKEPLNECSSAFGLGLGTQESQCGSSLEELCGGIHVWSLGQGSSWRRLGFQRGQAG